MKKPPKLVPIMLAAGLLSTGIASAGLFTTDFSTQNGVTLGGQGSTYAFIETNRVILTPGVAGYGGSLTVWDMMLDSGQPVESFLVTFKLQMGPGSGNPADGVSFNFGPNVVDGGVYSEEGPGGGCLTIAFDTYDNGLANEGVPTPAVDVRFNGRTVATHPYAKADMITSQLENVAIELKKNGSVTVTYKGQVIHENVLVDGWAPVAGLFNISARSGGEYAEHHVDDLSITTVVQGTAVAASITADPLSATVIESATASTNFSVAVDGSAPFTYQWVKNDVDILDATTHTLTLTPIHYVDNNAKIKCRVTNPVNTVTSGEATLTVIRDDTRPTVVSANADTSGTLVTVVFSEAVTDTALAISSYSITPGISVLGVNRLAANRVALTTSQMPQGQGFTLTINGVQDTATTPPNTIAANTQIGFRTVVFQVGAVLHKKYLSMADGTPATTLFTDPRYNNNPDRQELMPMWEYPINGGYRDAVADPARNYMDTLEGYFMPPSNGDYVFFIAGADYVWLYLSTDDNPANKLLVAQFSGWTNPREWLRPQADPPGANDAQTNNLRTDRFTNTQWPTGDPVNGGAIITLAQNQRYYMELVHMDPSWSGADDFAVTFTKVGEADPAPGTAPALTGNVVGTYLDPTGASVTFNQQPTSATILAGRRATVTVQATGSSVYGSSVTLQWQTAPSGSSTWTDIAGATSASYITPVLTVAESGVQYRVKATVPGLSEFSEVAVITVIADTIPPALVAAGAIPSQTGATFDVGVTFDEAVDAVSAGTLANYSLSAGTIDAVKFYAGSPGAVLTVSGLTAGNTYTVNVNGVKDLVGNTMTTPASKSFTIAPMKWGVVGASELQLGNAVLTVAPNGFDVYSDGLTEWGTYDEATFVYEEVTGDFDKEVRVEFQDASSQWARAGIIARDVTNFGVNRAAQDAGAAGRYQKCHVNPVTTAMGTPGNNAWEGNRRLSTGATTTSGGGAAVAPQYPNAWCRIQRRGQVINLFRSDNGVDWISIGSSTFPEPLPETMYVGPEYSPENGNVSEGLRSVFVAKFRDYRTHSDVVPPPVMTYQRTPTGFTITYEGTLESNTDLTNPSGWTPVSGAVSPYPVTPVAGPPVFYRAKK